MRFIMSEDVCKSILIFINKLRNFVSLGIEAYSRTIGIKLLACFYQNIQSLVLIDSKVRSDDIRTNPRRLNIATVCKPDPKTSLFIGTLLKILIVRQHKIAISMN